VKTIALRSLVTLSSFPSLARGYRARYSPPPDSTQANLASRRAQDRDQNILLRALFGVPPPTTTHPADPVEECDLVSFEPYDPCIPASGGPRHSTRYLSKRAVMCPVTGTVARYRDPQTGLPYANTSAFKMLRSVATGERGIWSGLLHAWIGDSRPAHGVPMDVWQGKVELKPQAAEEKK